MKLKWIFPMISAATVWAQAPATPTAMSREQANLPEWGRQFVDALQVQSGSTVADVGAGSGKFLPVWSAAVGSAGRVIAEDIDKRSLDQARKLSEDRKSQNVEFVLGTATDAMLPERCADLIIVIDAYHEFKYPAEMLASLSKALKNDGRLAIIDFYKPDKPTRGLPVPEHIRLNKDEAINEIVSNGFRLLSGRDFMQGKQYVAIFVQDHAVPDLTHPRP